MLKVVFFGTPEIATKSLEYLANLEDVEVCAVVTKIDKPQGRGQKLMSPPVKQMAQNCNLPCFQSRLLRQDGELLEKLKDYKPDFFITFAYGQILSQEVLDIPTFGTINLHASLLPKYRGANPIQCAIVNGECKTGITTMLTVVELDAGDICLTKEINILPDMTDSELSQIIAEEAPELIYKTMKQLVEQEICPIPQKHSDATFTCKFSKEDACIDWEKPASQIHNKIRGLCSSPCCYSFINNKLIKITKSILCNEKTQMSSGTYLGKTKEGLKFACAKGEVIVITKVKPEGKSEMRSLDWLNGAKLNIGDSFLNYKG